VTWVTSNERRKPGAKNAAKYRKIAISLIDPDPPVLNERYRMVATTTVSAVLRTQRKRRPDIGRLKF
jgi:hypothetical protein